MGFDNRHFAASLYTRSPYAHCMPCLPQYGRWDFEKDTGAVHRIWYSHSSKVKHLPILRPPPFTRTQISSAINRQSFHSRTINLCSRWPYYELPGLRSSYTRMRASNSLWLARKFLLFIYLFLFYGSRFAYVRLLPFALCYIMSRLRLKCDGTRAETGFCLSAKRTSQF